MRRLLAFGLIAAGIAFTFVPGCGSDDPANTFPNGGGKDGSSDATSSGTSGFGGTSSGTSGSPGDDDDIPDTGPLNDAQVPVCGNGIQTADEGCDDKNTTPNDGCSATCTVEPGYVCNVPGQACAKLGGCGDGQINDDEECDDKNTVSNDGCSTDCKIENGWICPIPGASCSAKQCGDGVLAGNEECDDHNTNANDGCSKTCTIEDGFKCPTVGAACSKTVCGDKKIEGTEQCDDGNVRPFDGCAPDCTKEPVCPKTGGACTGACGDGIVFPGEGCDDGNVKDGDGCSHDCKVEDGYDCALSAGTLPGTINTPIIYRDFSRGDKDGVCSPNGCDNGHPDFDNNAYANTSPSPKGIPGLLFDNGDATKTGKLDANGRPVYHCTLGDGAPCTVTNAASFAQWYEDIPDPKDKTKPFNYTFLKTLPLSKQPDGTYQYNSNGSNFFPIDGLGFGNQYKSPEAGGDHNFHFTSELRFWFQYDQQAIDNPPSFAFTGDDDVYVFINAQLAVDIGGVHGALDGAVTLNPTNAGKLGLQKDKVYEFALFQAERNRSESNYKATFQGFARAKSVCTAKCGDGIQTKFEACDDGKQNDTNKPPAAPAYGKCSSDCKSRGPNCGDGTTQNPPESCDDGPFNGGYNKCNATCTGPGPKCGDSNIDTIYGELCDDGPNNDTNPDAGGTAYGKCSANCRERPRCGDGIINGPEQCDGAPVGGVPCTAACTLNGGNPH